MKDVMKLHFAETTVARLDTTAQGFIDDIWASIDTNYTPSAIELKAHIVLVVQNGSAVQKTFVLKFTWYEDAATQNTRMKDIWAAFTAGITAMEGASSYTTVVSLTGHIRITVTYA